MSEETTQEKPESRALLLRLQELANGLWESEIGEDESSELAEMQDIINALLHAPTNNKQEESK